MRTTCAFLSPLLVALLLTTTLHRPDGPKWLDDPDAAFALAAETGRPLLIVFRCET